MLKDMLLKLHRFVSGLSFSKYGCSLELSGSNNSSNVMVCGLESVPNSAMVPLFWMGPQRRGCRAM